MAYSQQLTLTGGTAPVDFALLSGSLPDGISLTSGGLLSGTPTAVGTSPFTIRATDSGSCATVDAPLQLEIAQPVPVTPTIFVLILMALLLAAAGWMALVRRPTTTA